MTFCLQVRSIPDVNDDIESKHLRFVAALQDLDDPWRPATGVDVAPIGGQLSTGVKASKLFGKGLGGELMYRFRGGLRDEAACDDFLHLTFKPAKFDFREIAEKVLPAYVRALDGYVGEVFDDEFDVLDYEERKAAGLNRRHSLFRVPAALYMSDAFASRAFGRGAVQCAKALDGFAARVTLLDDGVLVVLTFEVLPPEQFDGLSREAKRRLLSPLAS